jgi:hypothetical protein
MFFKGNVNLGILLGRTNCPAGLAGLASHAGHAGHAGQTVI